jgi:hypothetical protein
MLHIFRIVIEFGESSCWNDIPSFFLPSGRSGRGDIQTMANRTIRLFVSSTFTDFQGERGVLHEDVFPEIRRICASNGFEFEPIDLRWGISDGAALEGHTAGICFDEIAGCQAVSPRLNLFFLVENRYGWRPLPEVIPHTAFDALIRLIRGKAPETAGLFEAVYRRDDNAIPPSCGWYRIPVSFIGRVPTPAWSR